MIIGEHSVSPEIVLGGSIKLLTPSVYEVKIERQDLPDLFQVACSEKEARSLLARIDEAVLAGQEIRAEYVAASGDE